jgi:hypothetical protein
MMKLARNLSPPPLSLEELLSEPPFIRTDPSEQGEARRCYTIRYGSRHIHAQ